MPLVTLSGAALAVCWDSLITTSIIKQRTNCRELRMQGDLEVDFQKVPSGRECSAAGQGLTRSLEMYASVFARKSSEKTTPHLLTKHLPGQSLLRHGKDAPSQRGGGCQGRGSRLWASPESEESTGQNISSASARLVLRRGELKK